MGEDEFWIYDDDEEDADAFEDENWEYFDEAAAAAEEVSKPQFLKGRAGGRGVQSFSVIHVL